MTQPVGFEKGTHSCQNMPNHVLARKNLYRYFPDPRSGKVILVIVSESGSWFLKEKAQDSVGMILKFEIEFCPFCGIRLG
ncbi:MAG: hypothetical protein A3D41_04990 [Candidatus Sungbacteria bacterium RIFCSPHIGHO2_02_FULL_41_12b]|nr:MAG: hypothetical protein A3D41_04990 [Candidatus Sungbacteria bacterium RIFCSPHIGHO2_02_FULL_41_12b]